MKKLLLSMLCLGALTAYAGNGTEASPYTCAEVIAMGTSVDVASATVQGYIVGNAPGQAISSAVFTTSGVTASNVLIADSPSETDYNNCVPVQLVGGSDIRAAVNLKDNPGNLGKTLTITGQLIKYFGVPGVKAPTAYKLDGQGGGSTEPTGEEFVYAANVTSGKKYALVADGKVAKPVDANKTYGYLYVSDVTVTDGKITTAAANGFLFTAVDGGYTIQDNQNRYLYMTGNYNSFNVSDARVDGDVWTVEANADGSVKITNVAMSKYVQYRSQYTSFGAYPEAQENATMPNLYEYTGTVTPPTPPTPTEAEDIASVAEFISKASASPVRFTCPLTAIYQNGIYMYVTDGKNPLLIYGDCGKTYVNGDIIPAGVVGTYKNFNGQIELTSLDKATFGDPTKGAAVEPEVYQVEELSTEMCSEYIRILAVKVEAEGENFTMTDGTGDVALFNRFKVGLSAGEYNEFVGFVAVYNNALQLYPINDLGTTGGDEPNPGGDGGAIFYAPEYTGVEGVALFNSDSSSTCADAQSEDGTLIGVKYELDGVTLEFTHGDGNYYAAAFGKEIRWYQGETLTLTPAAGVTIEKVFFKTTANSKGDFTANQGSVEGTGVGVANPITWTGAASTPIVMKSNKQVRFNYVEVSGKLLGVENVAVDLNAPVEYYNLQGVRVANPENGLFIRRQGNNVTKVIVK